MKQINGYVGLKLNYDHLAELNGYKLDEILNNPIVHATKDEKTLATILKKAREGKPLNKPICIIYNEPTYKSPVFVGSIYKFNGDNAEWIGFPVNVEWSTDGSFSCDAYVAVKVADGEFAVREI